MPRFSVIIPVHNRPELARQAIDSVLAQTFTDHEIVAVDDASSDDTPKMLRAYGDKIRVVTLERQQGCEVARNAGAAAAHGGYLAFLDSDDLLFPWALDTYDFAIAASRQPALLVSQIVYFSTTPPALMSAQRGDTVEMIVFDDYLSRDRTVPSTASMIVVRPDVFAAAAGFRQSSASTFNMSDHDFLLRVGCHGPAVLLAHPRTVAYRNHAGNSTRDIRRVVEGMLRVIRTERHGGYPGGRARRFDRRAAIGGPALRWSRLALARGSPWLASRLLLGGIDMVLAKVLKKIQVMSRGMKPVTRLERTTLAQSAGRE